MALSPYSRMPGQWQTEHISRKQYDKVDNTTLSIPCHSQRDIIGTMTTTNATHTALSSASLIRRLMSSIYDLLLVLALWFVTGTMAIALNHGNAIRPDDPFYLFFVSILILISFFYYTYFWTHGGQTLGMKTWRIRLVAQNGNAVSWQQAMRYFFAALLSWAMLGLGFFWSVFDLNRATWHDKIAGCRILDLRNSAHAA